ncbi:hypothetical protein B0T26DRAFT_306308 [Lasiosphaeria miniovina]|uniref:Uncharacterized protein n=1 Tax=Lasiosphaeria miniovina TaxID=1954250 RepID=A0AA40DY30_9PEZI|nr:uncharacterized protein B0T26DRAFT_306308 [Lasiosphaeria miniovina]KAK0717892.1 hypothetical protein B0T26DRAFT_306308 [Lasiosphaeria miniovina]
MTFGPSHVQNVLVCREWLPHREPERDCCKKWAITGQHRSVLVIRSTTAHKLFCQFLPPSSRNSSAECSCSYTSRMKIFFQGPVRQKNCSRISVPACDYLIESLPSEVICGHPCAAVCHPGRPAAKCCLHAVGLLQCFPLCMNTSSRRIRDSIPPSLFFHQVQVLLLDHRPSDHTHRPIPSIWSGHCCTRRTETAVANSNDCVESSHTTQPVKTANRLPP